MVFVDKLTKYAHFAPLSHPYTFQTMAQAFIDNIVKLHGAPLVIISDMGIIFTIKMWNQILKSLNIQLRYNYSYTPSPLNSMEKRVNQGFENIYDA